MKTIKKTLTVSDFESAWGEKLCPFVSNKIKNSKLFYRDLTEAERDESIKKIIDFLLDKSSIYSGKHRYKHWEKGWDENLNELNKTKEIYAVTPHYFGKYPINRFRQHLIMALDKNFEVNMLAILEYWLFEKYLKGFSKIYEFGCGTGHNLLRLREVNKTTELWGLDWAKSSQKIVRGIAKTSGDKKIKAYSFDYFNPDKNFKIDINGAILTVASLEQTGKKYKKFINYILKSKPALCVHIEPTAETLDENNLLDYLSINYFIKRKYLDGYITYLKKLEKQSLIKIIKIQRSYIGSLYIDGYSVIIWKPL